MGAAPPPAVAPAPALPGESRRDCEPRARSAENRRWMVFGGSGAKPLFPLAAAVAWLRAAKAGPRKGERDKREGCKGRRSEKTAVDEATPSISLPVSLSLSLSLLPLPTAGVWKGADVIALLSSRAGSCGARPGKEEACGEESVVGREVEFFRRLRVEVEREESSLRRIRFPLSTSLPPFFPSSLPFEPLETSSSRHLDVNQSEKRT